MAIELASVDLTNAAMSGVAKAMPWFNRKHRHRLMLVDLEASPIRSFFLPAVTGLHSDPPSKWEIKATVPPKDGSVSRWCADEKVGGAGVVMIAQDIPFWRKPVHLKTGHKYNILDTRTACTYGVKVFAVSLWSNGGLGSVVHTMCCSKTAGTEISDIRDHRSLWKRWAARLWMLQWPAALIATAALAWAARMWMPTIF